MKRVQLLIAVGALALSYQFTQTSQAGPYIGIRIGVPLYVGPGYYGYPYPYAYPYYPYYPAPVVYQAAPAPLVYQAAPAPAVVRGVSPDSQPVLASPPPAVAAPAVGPIPQLAGLLKQLRRQPLNETVRRDAAMNLGRQKAAQAVDPVTTLLQKDPSPPRCATAAALEPRDDRFAASMKAR